MITEDRQKQETRIGTCPWCERKDQRLTSVLASHDGHIWSDWICRECLMAAHRRQEETEPSE